MRPMTEYEKEKVRDLVGGMTDEEKEIAREVLFADMEAKQNADGYKSDGLNVA